MSDLTLHYSSESNYKINFFWSKELGSKLGMLVWEGDQKHLPSFIIQTREERGVECNRPAGRECCRRSEAHVDPSLEERRGSRRSARCVHLLRVPLSPLNTKPALHLALPLPIPITSDVAGLGLARRTSPCTSPCTSHVAPVSGKIEASFRRRRHGRA